MRRWWFRGWMPFTGVPSGVCRSPSAWLPGQSPWKPGSTSSSTVRPAHSAGTAPVTSNHHVDHARPQASPTANGRYSAASASAAGTGSSGTCHAARVTGVRAWWTAGTIRSFRTRSMRASTSCWFWCMAGFLGGADRAVGWGRPGGAGQVR